MRHRISPCRCGAAPAGRGGQRQEAVAAYMREYDLQPEKTAALRDHPLTRDHAGPIFPDLAKGIVADGPNMRSFGWPT